MSRTQTLVCYSSRSLARCGVSRRPGASYYIAWHDNSPVERRYTIRTFERDVYIYVTELNRMMRVVNWRNP